MIYVVHITVHLRCILLCFLHFRSTSRSMVYKKIYTQLFCKQHYVFKQALHCPRATFMHTSAVLG